MSFLRFMQVTSGLAAPVAANRGASGIDGVLSTAAGFAFGLNRAVTLVVGDISFLHDINGLSLLRSGMGLSFSLSKGWMMLALLKLPPLVSPHRYNPDIHRPVLSGCLLPRLAASTIGIQMEAG